MTQTHPSLEHWQVPQAKLGDLIPTKGIRSEPDRQELWIFIEWVNDEDLGRCARVMNVDSTYVERVNIDELLEVHNRFVDAGVPWPEIELDRSAKFSLALFGESRYNPARWVHSDRVMYAFKREMPVLWQAWMDELYYEGRPEADAKFNAFLLEVSREMGRLEEEKQQVVEKP